MNDLKQLFLAIDELQGDAGEITITANKHHVILREYAQFNGREYGLERAIPRYEIEHARPALDGEYTIASVLTSLRQAIHRDVK